VLAAGLAAGCGGDDDGESGDAFFVDVHWLLSSGLDADGWEAAPPSATFADETVGGLTDCNRFTAPYTVDGDVLEIGAVASTQMACPPPADAVERAYTDVLGRVAGWRLDDAELVLLDDDGSELLRYREATPAGEWQVAAFLNGNAISSPLLGTEITATFAEDGTLTGSAGCNTYRTTFTTDRGRIDIPPPASTKRACPAPEGVMDQEAAYLAALPTAVRYRVDGGSLALLSADGTYVASSCERADRLGL
jgi:heat shock protein HslJ